MTKVRLVVEIDEEIRDALRIESALSGKPMADLVEDLIREGFPNAVKQVKERRKNKDAKKNGH